MDGFNESYNISVSCAIIMNQIISQAKKQNKLTYLNKKELNDLRLEWYIKSIRNTSKVITTHELKSKRIENKKKNWK